MLTHLALCDVALDHSHPFRGVVHDWWADHLPYWSLVRFLDSFFAEGIKSAYRYGVCVVSWWHSANTAHAPSQRLFDIAHILQQPLPPTAFVARALAVKYVCGGSRRASASVNVSFLLAFPASLCSAQPFPTLSESRQPFVLRAGMGAWVNHIGMCHCLYCRVCGVGEIDAKAR
jgi:hypothetical protein